MMGFAQIVQPGVWDTVQDEGRFGYMHAGVPMSGWMDERSAKLANHLLGNEEGAAVLEMHHKGPKIRFSQGTCIAISGAIGPIFINDKPVPHSTSVEIKPGDILEVGRFKSGVISYLPVSGGWQTDVVLGSRSMCKGITKAFKAEPGFVLPYASGAKCKYQQSIVEYANDKEILVIPGPEFDQFSDDQIKKILNQKFTLNPSSNRMAYSVTQVLPPHNLQPMLSSAVCPGVVQYTPSGKLFVLMKDGQTIGGYPKVLCLLADQISKFSQVRAGVGFWFKIV